MEVAVILVKTLKLDVGKGSATTLYVSGLIGPKEANDFCHKL